MPDKRREEFFTKLFLDDYNLHTGKQYEIVCSPEDDNKVSGTYDFLCKNKNSTNDYISIEEKSLNKSTENVRDNEEIRKIITEVNKMLDKRGLFYNKKYLFQLKFDKAPKSSEKNKYIQKITGLVEQKLSEDINADIQNQVAIDIQGYDCIKKFNIISTQRSKRVVFTFGPESNLSTDVQADTFYALSKIIVNSNLKLKRPKDEGKRTTLLITSDWNNFILADEHNIMDALQLIKQQDHENIDEIFYINKRSFEDTFDIHKVK